MKYTIYIVITIVLLSSCGPHRMRCGARGICKSAEKPRLEKPEKTSTIKV